MQYLLYPVAIYALLLALRYLINFLQICKITLQYPTYQLQTADLVPAYLKKLFQIPIAELEEFGFKLCSYFQVEPTIKIYPPLIWEILLYNQTLNTYAIVTVRRPIEPVNLFDVEFYTLFDDKSCLLTMNGKAYGLLSETPNLIVQDIYTAKTSVQWQAHQNKINDLSATKTPCNLKPEAFIKELEIFYQEFIDRPVKAGQIRKIQNANLFKFNWLRALKLTHNIIQGTPKAAAIIKQRREQAKTDPNIQVDIPIELEIEGFQRMEEMQQGLVDKKLQIWLLLGSLLLFVASFTQLFQPQTLAIFTAALLLHETGHVLAMKLFGYRDTSMLFIPFLGAVATARKDDATLTQKFWVSIAGPLPGLILGIALAIATSDGDYPGWVNKAGWILISLNLFNLLPVYPLDGGQIADLLVFSRHPYIGVLFKVFGVIILGLLGIDSPMLLLFAVLIAWTIPNSFRTAKVNIKLSKELRHNPPINKDKLLHFIFEHLKQSGYGNLPASTRYTMAKNLISRQYDSKSKWTTRGLLIIVYCVSLLGGIAGSLQAIAPNWLSLIYTQFETPKQTRDRITKERQRQVDKLTETLRLNPNDINAYSKRSRLYTQLRNYKSAIADYNQILRLNPQDINTYQQRAQLRGMLQDHRGAIADYTATIGLNSKNISAYIQRGHNHFKLKNYKSALADANSAIALDPKQHQAYYLRSKAYGRLGDQKRASADRQKAINLYKALKENTEF